MQKTIILFLLVCLIFCAAQDSLDTQNLISTHLVNVVKRVSTDAPYLCPDNYVYLVDDFQLFNGVVCVKTAITDVQFQQGDCSPGWATIPYNEVFNNLEDYCFMLGLGDVVRVGFMGSLSADYSQSCTLSNWDTSRITQSMCVKRTILDIKLVPLQDNVCGEGMVLVTPQEAQANQLAYCSLLTGTDIVRLAAGGSISGPGEINQNGCKISYEERGDVTAAFCRAIKDSEPNENEEATFNAENGE